MKDIVVQKEHDTFVVMDSVWTKDQRILSAFRGKMPQYAHHAACGLLWKKALYIVGGEIEGVWSTKAYKFDFMKFRF
jgi:hypothetical protein